MTSTNDRSRLDTWLLPLLILVGFAVRLFRLSRQSFWFDEIVITHLAKQPFVAGLDGLLSQGLQLTPLDQWLTAAWLLVGDADWLIRFPSLLFSVLTIPLMYQLGRLYLNRSAGLLAGAIFAVNPFQVWYAQEARIYALLTLAAAGSMYAFLDLLRGGGKKAALRLLGFTTVGFAGHYFMFLLPAVQFLFILGHFKKFYRYFRPWLLVNFLAGLVLVPWFGFILLRQHFAIGIGWVPKPVIWDPLLTIWNFTLGYQEQLTPLTIIALIVIALALPAGILAMRRYRLKGQLLLLWFFAPLILVWSFSHARTSFYVDRYFLVISPALILLLAAGATELSHKRLQLGLQAALILASLYGLSQVHFNTAAFTRDDWRAMAATLRREARPTDGLVTCTDGYRLALDYYGLGEIFREQAHRGERYFDYPTNFDFNTVLSDYNRLWIVVYNPRQPKHHLGTSFPHNPDPARLRPTEQDWLAAHQPEIFAVAGLTSYRFPLDNPPDLNTLVRWICTQE